MNIYYPVYLELRDQPCIVVGGGKIAEGKVEGLLAVEAQVKIISPELTPHLQSLADENKIAYISRAYQAGDLTGAFMVICATDQPEINHQVWQEASANHQLVNVVDDTPRCNFIAPSILRNGDLTIAISTSGKAPALAVRLKERLQKELGHEYADFLELAGHLREPLARTIPDFATRKKLWYEIVDSGILDVLAEGDEEQAIEIISEKVGFEFQPRVKA
ncbi:MAG: bifunctional precorrin-2 dehydrogenase/sirohydrochlorin ferrochelatase [Chloroflexi bacterium]|nr:bifunctional precorrin-2 dehydrogenase/sirohydrochlorin ferrochelatase [Chloroflexota bacterium]MBI3169944.1 bifunctional precorrin-2 dehydrogenase/sirohydrochlorin ferrochelatase [Chloroflexota bacterium]